MLRRARQRCPLIITLPKIKNVLLISFYLFKRATDVPNEESLVLSTLCVMPFVSTALPHSSNYTITVLQRSERETVMTSGIEGLTGLGAVGWLRRNAHFISSVSLGETERTLYYNKSGLFLAGLLL